MTRQTKTPAQRAQEALDLERRKRTRLRKKVDTMRAELALLETELETTEKRVEYLANNPDLPTPTPIAAATTEGETAA